MSSKIFNFRLLAYDLCFLLPLLFFFLSTSTFISFLLKFSSIKTRISFSLEDFKELNTKTFYFFFFFYTNQSYYFLLFRENRVSPPHPSFFEKKKKQKKNTWIIFCFSELFLESLNPSKTVKS